MRDRTLIQKAAALVGATFLLVGIAGFVPGITTHLYSGLKLAGHDGNAKLLGLFEVSVLHNVVHLLYGVAGLAFARAARTSRDYLVFGGAVYLVLWLYGLLIDRTSGANFVPLNSADNWLHFVLGLAMIGLGLTLYRRVREHAGAGRAATGARRA